MNYFIKYRINLYSKYKKHINNPNTINDKTTYAPICWFESCNILINLCLFLFYYLYFYFIICIFILLFVFYYIYFRFLLYIFLQCYYNEYGI